MDNTIVDNIQQIAGRQASFQLGMTTFYESLRFVFILLFYVRVYLQLDLIYKIGFIFQKTKKRLRNPLVSGIFCGSYLFSDRM